MTTEFKTVMASTMYEIGTMSNELHEDGYTISEGWPIQRGWMFEIQAERNLAETEVPKKSAGRPPKAA